MDTLWTIHQLADRVAEALAEGAEQASGRVRDIPDVRTIRYYTTLGLFDRPAEVRGRTAYYGQRHLLQLLAIKRLQAQGATLVQVQTRLAGADDNLLAQIARYQEASHQNGQSPAADTVMTAKPMAAPAAAPPVSRRQTAFWEETAVAAPPAPAPPSPTISMTPVVGGVEWVLAPGVSVWLAGVDADQISREARAALQPVFEQLLQTLAAQGLMDVRGVSKGGTQHHSQNEELP